MYLFLCPATDGFPGLRRRPLPVAEEGRRSRREIGSSADRTQRGRADDQISRWARQVQILSPQAKKRYKKKSLVSFFMPCDRRVSGAAAPTAAGGRRRKVMQARNREFRRQNAERESGRPDFEVGKAGSNPVSASEKEIQEKILYLFLMPCDRRGFYRFRNWKKETQ